MPLPAHQHYRLVLFDFDGTLADSRRWFVGVFDQVADRYGYKRLAPGDHERLRGLDTHDILRQLDIPIWKVPLIARHVRELATRDIATIPLFPGATTMLTDLAAGGVRIAVVSSNTEANVRRVLGPATRHVDRLACGAGLFGKAARLRAVLRATSTHPSQAIFIGDEARDIAAARAAGTGSAAVAWGYADPVFLRSLAPTLFFEQIEEIAPTLVGHNRRGKS